VRERERKSSKINEGADTGAYGSDTTEDENIASTNNTGGEGDTE